MQNKLSLIDPICVKNKIGSRVIHVKNKIGSRSIHVYQRTREQIISQLCSITLSQDYIFLLQSPNINLWPQSKHPTHPDKKYTSPCSQSLHSYIWTLNSMCVWYWDDRPSSRDAHCFVTLNWCSMVLIKNVYL